MKKTCRNCIKLYQTTCIGTVMCPIYEMFSSDDANDRYLTSDECDRFVEGTPYDPEKAKYSDYD